MQQIREETKKDDSLELLIDVIANGWPEEKSELPIKVMPYFSFRDELSTLDGLVFCGEHVVVPTNLRQTMKERVHSSHIGIEGCLRRACECIINKLLLLFIIMCSHHTEYHTCYQI